MAAHYPLPRPCGRWCRWPHQHTMGGQPVGTICQADDICWWRESGQADAAWWLAYGLDEEPRMQPVYNGGTPTIAEEVPVAETTEAPASGRMPRKLVALPNELDSELRDIAGMEYDGNTSAVIRVACEEYVARRKRAAAAKRGHAKRAANGQGTQ